MKLPITPGMDWLSEQRSVRDVTLADVDAAIESNEGAQAGCEPHSLRQQELRNQHAALWDAKRTLQAEAARAEREAGKR